MNCKDATRKACEQYGLPEDVTEKLIRHASTLLPDCASQEIPEDQLKIFLAAITLIIMKSEVGAEVTESARAFLDNIRSKQ